MKPLTFKPALQSAVAACLITLSTWATALELKPFSATELNSTKQQGKPVAVHFHADWCSTCVSQAKALEALKADPQLKGMTVLIADYDKEKDLRKSMKVRSQSVMVVYKGAQEVSRVAGQTQPQEIKAAFLKAL